MALSVTKNPDGSWTATCGNDSVTIPAPTAPGGGPSGRNVVLHPRPTGNKGGVTANWHLKDETIGAPNSLLVSEPGQIIAKIEEAYRIRGPQVLRFEWSAENPLELSEISRAIGDAPDEAAIDVEIVFEKGH